MHLITFSAADDDANAVVRSQFDDVRHVLYALRTNLIILLRLIIWRGKSTNWIECLLIDDYPS